MYSIQTRYIAKNRSYRKLNPIGTVLHSTATPGATDYNEFVYFNRAYRGASAHAFVDWDSITQTIPWYEKAWHAAEPANSMFIGIELCEPRDNDPDRQRKFNEVWKRAVWLFAYVHVNLIKRGAPRKITKYNLMSHNEVSLKWRNTTHTDPTGYFRKYGKTVDQFRQEVQTKVNEMIGESTPKPPKPVPPKPAPQKTFEPVVTGTELVVTASALNCRTGPGINYPVMILDGKKKLFKKGDRLTGVDSVNGWWKLNVKGKDGYVIDTYTILYKRIELEVIAEKLECRTGPGENYPIMVLDGQDKIYKKYDRLTAVACKNGWWQLIVKGRDGFVKYDGTQRYIRVELEVTASALNCRTGPGTNHPVMILDGKKKLFRRGDRITAVGLINGWWKLRVKGRDGYVIDDYTKRV